MRALALLLAASLACAGGAPWPGDLSPQARDYLRALRRQVFAVWKTQVQSAALAADPTGCRYSRVNRRTMLTFDLDRTGLISNTRIVRPSGAPFLDELALGALQDGDRFPPPPPSLFREGPLVRLPFAFTLTAPANLDCTSFKDESGPVDQRR